LISSLQAAGAFSQATAVINATSAGLAGDGALDVPLETTQGRCVVMDMVYRPLETPFLAQARALGRTTVDGLEMLIRQAEPAFEAFSPEPWTHERDHSLDAFDGSLAAFTKVRDETLALLRALPPGAAERLGLSAFFGPVTLGQYATHIADHDLEHLAQMRECRRAAGA